MQNIHYKFFPNGYEIGFPGCTDAICTSFIDGTCIEFMINKTGYMYFTVSLNQPLDHEYMYSNTCNYKWYLHFSIFFIYGVQIDRMDNSHALQELWKVLFHNVIKKKEG